MSARYPYHEIPLRPDRKDIRLLQFDDGDVTDGVPLRCSFIVFALAGEDGEEVRDLGSVEEVTAPVSNLVDLARRLTYSAISYTWGSAAETASMIIDDHLIDVPINADIALRGLLANKLKQVNDSSGIAGKQDSPPLWIDALCINQENVDEKGQQVAMMGDIYSRAEEVLVWLGNDCDALGPAAAQLLGEIYADCARSTDNFAKLPDMMYPASERGIHNIASLQIWSPLQGQQLRNRPVFGADKWNLLTTFYSLPWFSRVWIVQEILLAKQATLCWGNTTFSWALVSLAAKWLQYLGGSNSQVTDAEIVVAGKTLLAILHATTLYGMSPEAHRWLGMPSEHSLSSLLFVSASFKATDPRDNVYGLLGLLPPKAATTGNILTPDYRLDLSTVYTAAANALLAESHGITFLKLAGLHQATQAGSEQLPSWVPRWGQHKNGSHGDCKPISDSYELKWAAPPRQVEETPASSRILRVRGHVVDTISVLGPSISPSDHVSELSDQGKEDLFLDFVHQILKIRDLAADSADNRAQQHTNFADSLIKTLCCGRTADREPIDQAAPFLENSKSALNILDTYTRGAMVSPNVMFLVLAVMTHSMNRIFFITSAGRFGMAPPGTRVSDRVVLMCGHAWPFVLRAVEGHWVLLGDVYVDGLMSGMYWKELFADGLQWFEIC